MFNLIAWIRHAFRRKQQSAHLEEPRILLKDLRPKFKKWRAQHPLPSRDELSLVDQHLADYALTVLEGWFDWQLGKSKPIEGAVFSSLPGIVATQEYIQKHELDLMYFLDGEINREVDEFYQCYFVDFRWLKQDYEQNPHELHTFLMVVASHPDLAPDGFVEVERVDGPHYLGHYGFAYCLHWDGTQLIQLEDFIGLIES